MIFVDGNHFSVVMLGDAPAKHGADFVFAGVHSSRTGLTVEAEVIPSSDNIGRLTVITVNRWVRDAMRDAWRRGVGHCASVFFNGLHPTKWGSPQKWWGSVRRFTLEDAQNLAAAPAASNWCEFHAWATRPDAWPVKDLTGDFFDKVAAARACWFRRLTDGSRLFYMQDATHILLDQGDRWVALKRGVSPQTLADLGLPDDALNPFGL